MTKKGKNRNQTMRLSIREKRIFNEQRRLRSQHSESGAGAVNYDDEEANAVIDAKLVERIKIQEEFFRAFLAVRFSMVELEELELYTKTPNEEGYLVERDYDLIEDHKKPKWYGIPYPKRLLIAEINCKLANLKQVISRFNYLKQALQNVGFKDTDIEKVQKGEIISDNKLLKQMEAEQDEKGTKEEVSGLQGPEVQPE